ncbi:geraniol 8-hydroxylase-like [Gossypium australe]|uniref:Geraniol 8-hydroxylase-like n=1 Tax=Gossypium australe TaxID=47621 RepID=A0A5B6VIH8_9ROSI|nr:geraniol 8-hydroxylase-like [Gossypium australe]
MSNTIFSIDLADSSQTSEEFREIVQGILEEAIRRRMTILLRKMMDLFDNVIDEWLELRR